jgi:hypothetical protein
MKLAQNLLGCLVLLVTSAGALAAAPATNAPPAVPVPVKKDTISEKKTPAVATVAAAQGESTLENYLKELTAELKLSDAEKKEIETSYLDDGLPLKNLLNNEALSPLQQAQQVADLRAARNTKIEALLADADRRQEFLRIEAKYCVALTELAANGGLVPPPPEASKIQK